MPRSNSCGIVFASLDVENGREHGALEDGDERGEVGVDLRVVLEVVGGRDLRLHGLQEVEGGAGLLRDRHSHSSRGSHLTKVRLMLNLKIIHLRPYKESGIGVIEITFKPNHILLEKLLVSD